ncbi:MAG: hypothetical protein JNL21_32210 [Myxococcales bacterium]|nr:hypothetical protein [Myxococcales bacterium]
MPLPSRVARNRFPLLDDPTFAPYAPLVNAAAPALLKANRDAPTSVGLVLETPDAYDVHFGPRDQVAEELDAIASRSGQEVRAVLRELAAHLRTKDSTEPGFDCVVVKRGGAALLRIRSVSLAEEGAYQIASVVSGFRGLEERTGEPLPHRELGVGFAVRSVACSVCESWKAALRKERIPLVGRVAPEEPPVGGEICLACHRERDSLLRIAAELYGLDADAVDRASEPHIVIAMAQLFEDWEGRHG